MKKMIVVTTFAIMSLLICIGLNRASALCTNHSLQSQHDNLNHWYICTNEGCTYSSSHNAHFAYCYEPEKCVHCGFSTEDGTAIKSITHNPDNSKLVYTKTAHYNPCSYCGEPIFFVGQHSRLCSEDACRVCGAPVAEITADVYHTYDGYSSDENKHWMECVDCHGARKNEGSHTVHCGEYIGGCAVCHRSIDEGLGGCYIWHSAVTNVYYHDDDQHWIGCICGDPSYKVNGSGHISLCTSPDECYICGATGVNFTETSKHNVNRSTYYKDANTHWNSCIRCDEKFNVSYHYALCDLTGKCAVCSATTATGAKMAKVFHYYNSSTSFTSSGDNHIYTCVKCKKTAKEPHDLTITHDGTWHWKTCGICWAVLSKKEYHRTSCDHPFTCVDCHNDVRVVGGPSVHYINLLRGFSITSQTHRFLCANCGKLIEEAHSDINGDKLCDYCGYVYGTVPRPAGDVNKDNKTNMADANAVLDYISGAINEIDAVYADVNMDGAVDGRDAMLLLQYAAGWAVNIY